MHAHTLPVNLLLFYRNAIRALNHLRDFATFRKQRTPTATNCDASLAQDETGSEEAKYDFDYSSDHEFVDDLDFISDAIVEETYGNSTLLRQSKPEKVFEASTLGNSLEFASSPIWKRQEGKEYRRICQKLYLKFEQVMVQALKQQYCDDGDDEINALPAQVLDEESISSERVTSRIRENNLSRRIAYRLYDQDNHLRRPRMDLSNASEVNETSVLAVSIYSLKFIEHPLFSKEERLCESLKQLFFHYQKTSERRLCDFNITRLEHLLQVIDDFLNDNSKESCKQTYTRSTMAKNLLCSITKTFSEYYEQKLKVQNLVNDIIATWEQVQVLRKQQGYQTKSETILLSSLGEKAESDTKEKVERMLFNHEDELKLLRSIRECLPKLYQTLNQHEDEVKEQSSLGCAEFNDGNAEIVSSDKVKNMYLVLDDLIRSDCKAEKNITLIDLPPNQDTNNFPENEIRRIKSISNQAYIVNLAIDDHVIATSKTSSLSWPDLAVVFDETIRHELTNLPNSISIRISQRTMGKLMGTKTLCTIFMKVPHHAISLEKSEISHDFACCYNDLRIRGTLKAYAKWETTVPTRKFSLKDTERKLKNLDRSQKIGISTRNCPTTVYHNSHIKYNRNLVLLITEANELQLAFKVPGTSIPYINTKESLRHEMIIARSNGIIPWKEIPLVCNDNSEKLFCKESSRKGAFINQIIKRQNVNCEQAYETVSKIYETEEKKIHSGTNLSWNDIISESSFPVPFSKLSWPVLPSRMRILRPQKSIPSHHGTIKENHFITVSIISASNVPYRENRIIEEESTNLNLNGQSGKTLIKSFIRLTFQSSIRQTSICEGQNPLWRQTLQLPIDIDDYSPAKLRNMKDNLEIEMFDKITFDAKASGGYYEDEDTLFTENMMIGRISIPFTSIYSQNCIEEYLRLDIPDFHLGYTHFPPNIEKNLSFEESDDAHGQQENSSSVLLLKVAISIEPSLPELSNKNCKLSNPTDDPLMDSIDKWQQRLLCQLPEHRTKLTELAAKDINGAFWIVPRFLKAQAPPEEINTISKCVHFVSLIPLLDNLIEPSIRNWKTWLTNQQVIDVKTGGKADHAILLANFFLSLQKTQIDVKVEVYLALGFDLVLGDTIYVVRKEKSTKSITFYEPVSGQKYEHDDETCPLQYISYLIGENNIHANLKVQNKPPLLHLDTDSKDWHSLYSSDNIPPITSIQEATLIFDKPNLDLADEIKDELLETLRREVRRCRRKPTSFLNDISMQTRLNIILHQLEENRINDVVKVGNYMKGDLMKPIHRITGDRKVYGQPMHFAFTETDDIIKKIKTTKLHQIRHPDAEFAIAVKVFPYSGNIFSIWVCMMIVIP